MTVMNEVKTSDEVYEKVLRDFADLATHCLFSGLLTTCLVGDILRRHVDVDNLEEFTHKKRHVFSRVDLEKLCRLFGQAVINRDKLMCLDKNDPFAQIKSDEVNLFFTFADRLSLRRKNNV